MQSKPEESEEKDSKKPKTFYLPKSFLKIILNPFTQGKISPYIDLPKNSRSFSPKPPSEIPFQTLSMNDFWDKWRVRIDFYPSTTPIYPANRSRGTQNLEGIF